MPPALPDMTRAWFCARGKTVRKRRVQSLSPSRRSQRLTEKNAGETAVSTLEELIRVESFEIDTVAIRLRATQRQKRMRDNDEGVCSFACSQSYCTHPKVRGPQLNYMP